MRRKILAGLMSICLLVSAVPMGVSATSGASCTHASQNYWWDTEEERHQQHCGDCGADLSEFEAHADVLNNSDSTSGTDGLCDVCNVNVDNTIKHTHEWSSQWYANNDNTEHFQNCIGTGCTKSTNPHTAVDSDSNGLCDSCNLSIGNQSGPSNQPRFDWDFSNGGFEVPINGTYTIDVLDGNRPANSTVDVLLGYVDTNGAFVPYEAADQKGIAVTYDSNGVPTSVTFDGAVIYANNQLAMNSGYFHVAIVVKDSTGTIIASNGCDVHLDGYSSSQGCAHTNIRYDISESSHTKLCADCNDPLESTTNHVNNGNGKCSDCDATLDANGEHQHDVGNNQWTALDGMEHSAPCTGCSVNITDLHGDDANNPDGLCDICDMELSTNIQFNAMGGEFVFKYENGLIDLNAPHTGIGVLYGKSSAESNYSFIEEPTYSGYTFKGWRAEGRKYGGSTVVLADTSNLMTTAQVLAYKASSEYEVIEFSVCWADSNGIVNTQSSEKTGVQFDVWDGSAKYTYNGNDYTSSAARYYVNNGEYAGKYGSISDPVYENNIPATFKGWTLEIIENGVTKYEGNNVMSTADALAYVVDNTTYPNSVYMFTAQWEMPDTVEVEFFTDYGAKFTATNTHDAGGSWSTNVWHEQVYVGASFNTMGYSISDPVLDTGNSHSAAFLGWDMYAMKASESKLSLVKEKLTTAEAIANVVDNTYTVIQYVANWGIKHIASENKQEANYKPCRGGIKTEWYPCDICGYHVDADGNELEWEDPITAHTIGDKMAPNYTACDGGFKTEWYICSVCEEPLDKNGNSPEYVPGTGHTDTNYDNVCDICTHNAMNLYTSLSTDVYSMFDKAMKAAVNNDDYTDMINLFGEDMEQEIRDFVDAYKTRVAEGTGIYYDVVLNGEVVIKKELTSDPDLKPLYDNAVATSGGNFCYLFALDITGNITDGDFTHGMSMSKLCETQKLDLTVCVESSANRIWSVYATDDFGATYTKLAESAKGSDKVEFSTEGLCNEETDSLRIFALMYKDAAETPSHSHSYGSYESDGSKHWKECSCGAKASEGSHADGNKDGKCDSCGYKMKTESSSTLVETVTAPQTPVQNESTATTTTTTTTTTTQNEASEETVIPSVPEKADTTVVEIVASEEVVEAVKETVVVSEGTATVDKTALEAVVEATTEEEPVILPLAQATEEVVEKAEIHTEALTVVAEAEKDVVIELSEITVKIDASALKAITEEAGGETIEIRAVKAEKHALSEEQQSGLDDHEVETVISAQIFSDGKYIGDFKGGKVTIKVPFEPKEGRDGKDHKVLYVADNGETSEVPSEYVDGHMVFTTGHFSDYVIVYETAEADTDSEAEIPAVEEAPAEAEVENDSASFPIVPVIVIAVVVIAAAVLLVMKKKRTED